MTTGPALSLTESAENTEKELVMDEGRSLNSPAQCAAPDTSGGNVGALWGENKRAYFLTQGALHMRLLSDRSANKHHKLRFLR